MTSLEYRILKFLAEGDKVSHDLYEANETYTTTHIRRVLRKMQSNNVVKCTALVKYGGVGRPSKKYGILDMGHKLLAAFERDL